MDGKVKFIRKGGFSFIWAKNVRGCIGISVWLFGKRLKKIPLDDLQNRTKVVKYQLLNQSFPLPSCRGAELSCAAIINQLWLV